MVHSLIILISHTHSSSRVRLLSTFLRFFPAAMVDSVQENLQASRRFMLLYNASTYCTKTHTCSNNNNIISKDGIINDGTESQTEDSSSSGGGGSSSTGFTCEDDHMYAAQRQQLEIVVGMHEALLEGSLKVRDPHFPSAVQYLSDLHWSWFCRISFTGDSSRAGGNQPSPVGLSPGVAASRQEEAGCRVLVEEPETKATMAGMHQQDSGREDQRK